MGQSNINVEIPLTYTKHRVSEGLFSKSIKKVLVGLEK